MEGTFGPQPARGRGQVGKVGKKVQNPNFFVASQGKKKRFYIKVVNFFHSKKSPDFPWSIQKALLKLSRLSPELCSGIPQPKSWRRCFILGVTKP